MGYHRMLGLCNDIDKDKDNPQGKSQRGEDSVLSKQQPEEALPPPPQLDLGFGSVCPSKPISQVPEQWFTT
jgi:hypothetical protein